MKKIIVLFVGVLMLTACGNSNSAAPSGAQTPNVSAPSTSTTSIGGVGAGQEWLNKYAEVVQKIKKAKASQDPNDAMEMLALIPQLQKMSEEAGTFALKMSPEERARFEEQLNKLSEEIK